MAPAFDPRAESVCVHSLKFCAMGPASNLPCRRRFQHLLRERNVEAFAAHGLFTLLPIIEVAQTGDVLDISYTIQRRSGILPENCCRLFRFPTDTVIVKYHVSLRFSEGRAMRWKSSSAELVPEESREGSGHSLDVEGGASHLPGAGDKRPRMARRPSLDSNLGLRKLGRCRRRVSRAPGPETPTIPPWRRSPGNWPMPSRTRWPASTARYACARMRCSIWSSRQASRGMIPSPPGLVARRRFGDGKDMAFLLVHLLRRLGFFARPILVNTTLRKSVADLLPADDAFDHVLVEFHQRDQTRWVDPMSSRQGGGALNRAIPDYGAGLPIERREGSRLAPRPAQDADLYDLKETILLDTTGKASWISAVTRPGVSTPRRSEGI